MYSRYLLAFTSLIYNMDFKQKEWKAKLRQEWKDSMKLPRKKKKQKRKEILLNWQIANYNPLKF